MNDYLFLMHRASAEVSHRESQYDWATYIAKLQATGNFGGGSAIGTGECVTKSGAVQEITSHLTGYVRVQAENMHHARKLLEGNPLFEAGGTVEIRELPRTD